MPRQSDLSELNARVDELEHEYGLVIEALDALLEREVARVGADAEDDVDEDDLFGARYVQVIYPGWPTPAGVYKPYTYEANGLPIVVGDTVHVDANGAVVKAIVVAVDTEPYPDAHPVLGIDYEADPVEVS